MRGSRTLAAAVGSVGGLIFGYDLGALSATAPNLRATFHLGSLQFGLTLALSLWGTVCGSIVAGRLADKVGRPRLIQACAAVYLLAAGMLLLPFTQLMWALVLGERFVCGVAIGGLTVGCPLYLAEVAPREVRGSFVGSFQLQVGLGVLLAFAVGAVAAHKVEGASYGRVCLGLAALPAIVLLVLSRYMISVPLADHDDTAAAGHEEDRLFSRKYLRPLLLATSIALFNQLSGVNILLLYLLDVLSSAGLNVVLSHHYSVLISGFTLLVTLGSMGSVDRIGRKPLLVAGAVGMALCLFSLAVAIPHHIRPLVYVFLLVAYNGFFAFSQGTVVWIYLSELFPPKVRGTGQGYGTTVHWIANAALVLLYPVLQRAGPTEGFYVFGSMMLLQVIVVVLWYPETKASALGRLSR